jgi:ATP-dependent Lon protease
MQVEYRDKETKGEKFHKADLHIHYPRLSDDASALMGAPTVLALAQLMRGVFFRQRVAARGELTIGGGIIPTEGTDESNSITIEDIDVLVYAKDCEKMVSSVEMDLHGVTDVKEMLQYAFKQ